MTGVRRGNKLKNGTNLRTTITFETVLPIVFVNNINDIGEKYKPFNILQDYHPEESEDVESTKELSISPTSKKRIRTISSNSTIQNGNDINNNNNNNNGKKTGLTPRVGWADKVLNEETPYSLLKRSDLFERCKYIIDHEDYEWCELNTIKSSIFSEIITQLERNFAKNLLAFTIDNTEEKMNNSSLSSSVINNKNKKRKINNKNNNNNNNNNKEIELNSSIEVCGVCTRSEFNDELGSFLHCSSCGCHAHLYCWFMNKFPRNLNNWRCPVCLITKRESNLRRCFSCGRVGGVMFPYISSSEITQKKDYIEEEVKKEKISSSSSFSSLFCHIICGLAFDEMNIDTKRRVIYPIKRFKKTGILGACVFCQSNTIGARVMCQHSECFETMHPICAQQAGTVECFRLLNNNNNNNNNSINNKSWDGCRFYCPLHFKPSIRESINNNNNNNNNNISVIAEAQTLDEVTLSKFSKNLTITEQKFKSKTKLTKLRLEAVKQYWVDKRARRFREDEKFIKEIQEGHLDFTSVLFHPNVMKISNKEAKLSRFICLIPEFQHYLNILVEGILPIPDEEYDDVQEYRKIQTRTRHMGNTIKLYEKMLLVDSHIKLFKEIVDLLHQKAIVRRNLLETDLKLLELRSPWGSSAR